MTRRLRDEHGHAWPITRTRCPVCSMPTMLPGAHPGCEPSAVLDVPQCTEVLRRVVDELGASPLPASGSWRKSGDPVRTRVPVPSPRTSITDNRQEIHT